MRKQLFSAAAMSIMCLAVPATGLALDVQQPQTPGELREAQMFFENLMRTTNNPIIISVARDGLMKIKGDKKSQTAPQSEDPKKKTVAEIMLLQQPDSTYVVPALVNKKYMATFLVDTGASYTVITPEMAESIGIVIDDTTETVPITTANGTVSAPIVTLNNVSLGGLQVSNVEAVVADLGDNPQLSGLLGMTFFQGMELSFKRDRLVISR